MIIIDSQCNRDTFSAAIDDADGKVQPRVAWRNRGYQQSHALEIH